jgi:hypothetical protein
VYLEVNYARSMTAAHRRKPTTERESAATISRDLVGVDEAQGCTVRNSGIYVEKLRRSGACFLRNVPAGSSVPEGAAELLHERLLLNRRNDRDKLDSHYQASDVYIVPSNWANYRNSPRGVRVLYSA